MTDYEKMSQRLVRQLARERYDDKHDIVTVQMRVPRSERDAWRGAAAARGLSFTGYVRHLIANDLKNGGNER